MVVAALGGGLVGAVLLLAAYFVGVALIGAGIGALVANLIWTQIEGDPHPFVVVLFSVAGALVATWLQRYVIILGTAFGGAWTMIVGAMAVMGDTDRAQRGGGGRRLGRLSDEPRARAALGAATPGSCSASPARVVQMFVTGGQSGRVVKPNKKKKPEE